MRHFPSRWILRILPFLLLAAAPAAHAQSKGGDAPAERGWGSAWQQPATEKQRKEGELFRKLVAAQKARNFPAAAAVCDQLIALEPDAPGPYMNRARVHDELKQYDLALADLNLAQEQARKKSNQSAIANILVMRARVHEQRKEYDAAIDDLRGAIKLNDKQATAYNNLAWIRATAPDAAFRNGPEGVRLARKALALAEKNKRMPTDTLAAAYAEANDFPRAIESEKQALLLAEKEVKDSAEAGKFREGATRRLQLFAQRQPYHADLP